MEKEKQVKEEIKEENAITYREFGGVQKRSTTQAEKFTTIDLTDVKTLYNLENAECDYKINDCVDQSIRVKDVLIKNYYKPLDEPVVDENGEIVREFETSRVCILIDAAGKTYVTASKMFTIQMMRFINDFGVDVIKNGLDIKIVKKKVKNSSNTSLGFELI